jgi:2'-5' RNA ligase
MGRRAMDRLFFAACPDPDAAAEIDRFSRRFAEDHGLAGRRISPDRLHVTLLFLGDFSDLPDTLLASAMEAAGRVRMRPFTAAFDRILSFRRRTPDRPLVLVGGDGVAGFRALRTHLIDAMTGEGLRASEAEFTPHITLSYDAHTVEEQFVDRFTWPVSEFRLLRSLIGQSRYIELGRWTLSGDSF